MKCYRILIVCAAIFASGSAFAQSAGTPAGSAAPTAQSGASTPTGGAIINNPSESNWSGTAAGRASRDNTTTLGRQQQMAAPGVSQASGDNSTTTY